MRSPANQTERTMGSAVPAGASEAGRGRTRTTVSYTHLTLPTNREV